MYPGPVCDARRCHRAIAIHSAAFFAPRSPRFPSGKYPSRASSASLRARGRSVPVLPLDRSGRGAVAGQPMMVMGYPTGLEAILAKAESNVVKQILETQGPSSERVTEALSRQGLIRPTTTQGHIGDVTRTDIVFDAATTQGGSGGPVFNKHGEVIAVEYALLTKFGGNSFAIPIAYALELLSNS